MMSRPPIVGVPAFLRWDLRTSSLRTFWPNLRRRRRSMTQGPATRVSKKAVDAPIMARKVMYFRTRNGVSGS